MQMYLFIELWITFFLSSFLIEMMILSDWPVGEQRVVIQAGKRKQRKDDKGDDTWDDYPFTFFFLENDRSKSIYDIEMTKLSFYTNVEGVVISNKISQGGPARLALTRRW